MRSQLLPKAIFTPCEAEVQAACRSAAGAPATTQHLTFTPSSFPFPDPSTSHPGVTTHLQATPSSLHPVRYCQQRVLTPKNFNPCLHPPPRPKALPQDQAQPHFYQPTTCSWVTKPNQALMDGWHVPAQPRAVQVSEVCQRDGDMGMEPTKQKAAPHVQVLRCHCVSCFRN